METSTIRHHPKTQKDPLNANMSAYGMLFAKCAGLTALGTFLESKYVPLNSTGPAGLSNWYFVTPAILSMTGMWVTSYGFKVGAARRKAIENAKKDDEKDVEERYDLPNLYAQGTSKHARAFNCIQRSHQQIFEHFSQMVLFGLVGAVEYPLTSAFATLMYAVGRYAFSNGYASGDGDATKRYSSPLARYMWWGILTNFMLAMVSSVKIIAGQRRVVA